MCHQYFARKVTAICAQLQLFFVNNLFLCKARFPPRRKGPPPADSIDLRQAGQTGFRSDDTKPMMIMRIFFINFVVNICRFFANELGFI